MTFLASYTLWGGRLEESKKRGIIMVAKPSQYAPLYHNPGIDEFSYVTKGFFRNKSMDKCINSEGLYEIKRSKTTLTFNPLAFYLSGRPQQFFTFLIERFTAKVLIGASDKQIRENRMMTFDFAEIAQEFNLTVQQAKSLAVQSASMLKGTTITTYWRKNTVFLPISILQDYSVENDKLSRRGKITSILSEQLAHQITRKGIAIMQYPKNLRKIPINHHPYANALGYKLAVMYNDTFGKKNHGRVKMDTLFKVSCLPSRQLIDQEALQIKKRIITPFVRDMNILVDYGILENWDLEYLGNIISGNDYSLEKYKYFFNSIVVYQMAGFPDNRRLKSLQARTPKANTAHYPIVDDDVPF